MHTEASAKELFAASSQRQVSEEGTAAHFCSHQCADNILETQLWKGCKFQSASFVTETFLLRYLQLQTTSEVGCVPRSCSPLDRAHQDDTSACH